MEESQHTDAVIRVHCHNKDPGTMEVLCGVGTVSDLHVGHEDPSVVEMSRSRAAVPNLQVCRKTRGAL